MEKHYQERIDQYFRAYKDIILRQETNLEDEDYEVLEAQIICDLERAIEDKVRDQLLKDIKAYLSDELPF